MDGNSSSPGPQFTSESTINEPGDAPYAGAFFPSSQSIIVSGGVFTSIIQRAAPSVPSDVRIVTLGDIDLRNEIRLDNESGLVKHRHTRGSVRRIYSARIDGESSNRTVVIYQGDNAKEKWREDITKYLRLRHPNLVQIYGAASTFAMYGVIFNEDLIPFKQLLDRCRHSKPLTVYFYIRCDTDFFEAKEYVEFSFQKSLDSKDCTFWIRRSTGQLCADLIPNSTTVVPWLGLRGRIPAPFSLTSLDAPNQESVIVSSLTLDQYHYTCYLHFTQIHPPVISRAANVNLGAIRFCPSGFQEAWVEIAAIPDAESREDDWMGCPGGIKTDTGWNRYNSCDLSNATVRYVKWLKSPLAGSWLSQANYIFSRLEITSKLECYILVDSIGFQLTLSVTSQSPPEGYLFLCPTADLQCGTSSFRLPEDPAYWSFDPAGAERLSKDEAERLGFPTLELKMDVSGVSWESSIYAGIRQFHEAKGFDPDSQEVALRLGHPLLELSNAADAHVNADSGSEATTNPTLYLPRVRELNTEEPDFTNPEKNSRNILAGRTALVIELENSYLVTFTIMVALAISLVFKWIQEAVLL